MSQGTISFNFKETETDNSNYLSRLKANLKVTNPALFFISDQDVLAGVETVKKYEALSKSAPGGTIQVTQQEKESILRGLELWNAHCNDKGELVTRVFRMCGFVPVNVPIIALMMLTKPTLGMTAFSQALNQSYNAGLNFGNKNSSCEYTNDDLLKGYAAALTSSVTISMMLRILFRPLTKGASGNKLLVLNFIVSWGGSGSANFCNTLSMRYTEIKKGIAVYEDPDMTKQLGLSNVAAEKAVYNTASSRVMMSFLCLGTPVVIMLMLRKIGINPQSAVLKNPIELTAIAAGLYIGLPYSVALFPDESQMRGAEAEERYHKYDYIYYSRGK
jgi:hypothetical protein